MKKITDIQRDVEREISKFRQNPAETAIDIGTALANSAMKRLSKEGRKRN